MNYNSAQSGRKVEITPGHKVNYHTITDLDFTL